MSSLGEGAHGVCRRGESPLAALVLHLAPLIVEVEAQRAGAALRLFQRLAPGDDKPKARDALNAFVRR